RVHARRGRALRAAAVLRHLRDRGQGRGHGGVRREAQTRLQEPLRRGFRRTESTCQWVKTRVSAWGGGQRVTTILPKTEPASIAARPLSASSIGSTRSISGRTPVTSRKSASAASSPLVPI